MKSFVNVLEMLAKSIHNRKQLNKHSKVSQTSQKINVVIAGFVKQSFKIMRTKCGITVIIAENSLGGVI